MNRWGKYQILAPQTGDVADTLQLSTVRSRSLPDDPLGLTLPLSSADSTRQGDIIQRPEALLMEQNRRELDTSAAAARIIANGEWDTPEEYQVLQSLLTPADKKNLAGLDWLKTSRGLPFVGSLPPGITAGATRSASLNLLNMPGLEMYEEEHPVETAIGDLLGVTVPFSGAAGFMKARNILQPGKAASLLTRTGMRAGRDALTLGGIDAASSAIAGDDPGEVLMRAIHGATAGAAFGGTAELARPLPLIARLLAQGTAGAGTQAAITGDISPANLALGAALPMLLEAGGAAPEVIARAMYQVDRSRFLGSVRKATRSMQRAAAEAAGRNKPTGYKIDAEGRTLADAVEADQPGLARALVANGIPEAEAAGVAAGKLEPQTAVHRSLSAELPEAEYAAEFNRRLDLVNRTVANRASSGTAGQPSAVTLYGGVPLDRVLSKARDVARNVDPGVFDAFDRFVADIDRAVAMNDGRAMQAAVTEFIAPTKTSKGSGLADLARYYLGRTRERFSTELSPRAARDVSNEIRLRLAELELGRRAIYKDTEARFGSLWKAPIEDQKALRDVIKGVKGVDDQGNLLFATATEADAMRVRTHIIGGKRVDVVKAWPDGKGGKPVKYILGDKEFTPRPIDEGVYDLDGIPVLRKGDTVSHNGETIFLGDRDSTVRVPEPPKAQVELVDLNPAEGHKPHHTRLVAQRDPNTGQEYVTFTESDQPVLASVAGLKPGKGRVQHEGVSWIFDGERLDAAGAPKAVLRHPSTGKELVLPMEDGTIVVSPTRGVKQPPKDIVELGEGEVVYHNGREYAVKRVSRPQDEAREITEFAENARFYRSLNTTKTRDQLIDLKRRHPHVEELIADLRAREEQLHQSIMGRTLTPFSTEVVRRYHDIHTNRIPEAAYYPSVRKDQSVFSRLGETLSLGPRVASSRKFKSGRLATEGRELEKPGVAWAMKRGELLAEQIQADLEAKVLSITSLPIGAEGLNPGWVAIDQTRLRESPRKFVESIKRYPGIARMWGVDATDQARVRQLMNERQVPQLIASMIDDLGATGKRIANPRAQAVKEATDRFGRAATSYYIANMLSRPSTAMRNLLSGEILYMNKVMVDFYDDFLDALITKQYPGAPFAQVKNDLRAYTASLTRSARETVPRELLGGRFWDQFIQHSAWSSELKESTNLLNKSLIPFREVEILQKRRSFHADLRTDAERAVAAFEQADKFPGWAHYDGGRDGMIQRFMQRVPESSFNRARDNIRDYLFDYFDKPKFLQALSSWGGRAVVPFPNYIYHYLRLMTRPAADIPALGRAVANRRSMTRMRDAWELRDQTMSRENFDLALAENTAELRQRTARLLAAGSMWTLSAGFAEMWDAGRDSMFDQVLPYEAQTGGRVRVPEGVPFMGSDDDTESWVRVYDQPYLGEYLFIRDGLRGDRFLSDWFNDRLSLGLAFDVTSLAMGYRDDFNLYNSAGSRAADIATQFVPFNPAALAARRVIDPTMRDSDLGDNFFQDFAYGVADNLPGTSFLVPERRSNLTGQGRQYSQRLELLKFFLLNFKEVDVQEKSAAEEEAYREAMEQWTFQLLNAESAAERAKAEQKLRDTRKEATR